MLVVYGVYGLRPKRVAFRNDFCRTCQVPRRAFQQRTFDVFYVYWIPILPLGFWKRWFCTICGKQPHVSTGTRRPFKWIGLAILLLMAPVFWFIPPDPEIPSTVFWLFRIGFPVGAVLLLTHLLREPKEMSFKGTTRSGPARQRHDLPLLWHPPASHYLPKLLPRLRGAQTIGFGAAICFAQWS